METTLEQAIPATQSGYPAGSDSFHTQQAEREAFLHYGSWENNLETGDVQWSEGMWRLYDYPDDVRFPLTQEFYKSHVDPEDYEKVQGRFQDDLRSKGSYDIVYNITTYAGNRKRLNSMGKYVMRDGKAVKVIGLTKDVTLQEEYRQNLEAKVEELARSNKELEEFAYVASHDLQEPLRKMATFSERLQIRYKDALGADGLTYVTRIIGAADNMRRLIENLLDFSRISRVARNFERVDLNAVVRKNVQDFEEKIEESKAEISVGELPVIDGITTPIEQLICNLLSNALKFHKPGEAPQISVTAKEADSAQLRRFRLPAKQKFWSIEFSDKGIGFEQEYAEKIFAMFQRLHGKVEYPGSGMGLSICRKIAEIHGGKIYAEGKPGEGARFVLLIPDRQQTA